MGPWTNHIWHSVSTEGDPGSSASLNAYLPIGRFLGKYNTLPSFPSTQLFSVSPFYQWIRMLFTQQEKTKYNHRQHSFILPLMWWWWWETRGLHNPSWAQVWVLPCLSLAVRRRQTVLCPACQAKPHFLLGCTQNLKWRALAPVPALRNGKQAAGVQHSSPQTGPGQTWLGSDSCLTVSQLWGLGLATRLLWASASPSETCLMPSTSYCAWEAVMG